MITATVRALVAVLALGALGACAPTIQTTSGAAYLDAYKTPTQMSETSFRAKIREAALVEPTLQFPARIGLARVEGGRLTAIPPGDADAWLKTKNKLGSKFGTFVPISPLVAALASGDVGQPPPKRRRWGEPANLDRLIQRIRLGAARQHVDVVLIYEVIGKKRQSGTPLNLADLTIIGAYLFPSRVIRARGVATALLVDVRNGYPYGTAGAMVTDHTLAPTVYSTESATLMEAKAKQAVVAKLSGEVETMMTRLYAELNTELPRQKARR